MTTRRRILLVGAGRWGTIFAKNLGNHPHMEFSGVVTTKPEKIRPLIPEGCEVFSNFQSAMTQSWDGVILATPPETHIDQLISCLDKKIPTLVEKPLCLRSSEVKLAESLADSNNVPVLVDHIHLFHSGYAALKNFIREKNVAIRSVKTHGGALGPIRAYSSMWDYGSHDVAMILNLIGELPTQISAHGASILRDGGLAGSYELDFRFQNSIRTHTDVGNTFESKVRLFSVSTDQFEITLEDFPVASLRVKYSNGNEENVPFSPKTPMENLLDSFTGVLDGKNTDERWGIRFGRNVVEVLEACESSLVSGKPVTLADQA